MTSDHHYFNESLRLDLAELDVWHVGEISKINETYARENMELKRHWSGFGRSGSGMSIKAFEDLKRGKQNKIDQLEKEVERKRERIKLEATKKYNDWQAQQALRPTAEIPVTMPGKVGKVTSKPPKKRTQKQTIKTKIEAIVLKHLKKNRQASYDVMHGEIIKAKNGGKFPARHTCENWISKIRGEMNPPKPIR